MARTVESSIEAIINKAKTIDEVNSQVDRMVNTVLQAGYYSISPTKTENKITRFQLNVNEAVYGEELSKCLNAVKYYSFTFPNITDMRNQIEKAVRYFVLMNL